MAVSVKKILSVLGSVVVVAAIVVGAYLKYWNLWGAEKLGGDCNTRAGCRSFWCLKHEFVGSAERVSSGYCTDKCDTASDCKAGMLCVDPTPQALDDLAKYGRPSKLCERVLPTGGP